METYKMVKIKNGNKIFFRFTMHQRIQHALLASVVILLVLTGMPLKFHDAFWAQYLYGIFGGIRIAPVIHIAAGSLLIVLFTYHIIYLVYTFCGGQLLPMKKNEGLGMGKILKLLVDQPLMPKLRDLKDIKDLLRYLLFLTNERPRGAQFTWKEKFDYWAPFWGIVIIGLSGLIMWQKEFTTRFISGEVINYAIIAHSDEALLAALFLFIWHWYNVHFSTSVFPMGKVFITGYLSEELMVEEHYEYYVQVMKAAGLANEIRPPEEQKIKEEAAQGDGA